MYRFKLLLLLLLLCNNNCVFQVIDNYSEYSVDYHFTDIQYTIYVYIHFTLLFQYTRDNNSKCILPIDMVACNHYYLEYYTALYFTGAVVEGVDLYPFLLTSPPPVHPGFYVKYVQFRERIIITIIQTLEIWGGIFPLSPLELSMAER